MFLHSETRQGNADLTPQRNILRCANLVTGLLARLWITNSSSTVAECNVRGGCYNDYWRCLIDDFRLFAIN